MKKHFRSGDVNLREVKEVKGKIIQHDGVFVLAKGEVTGSLHEIRVQNRKDMVIRKDGLTVFISLTTPAEVTHTSDHKIIVIQPGTYRYIPERELDHFADSVERKVQD